MVPIVSHLSINLYVVILSSKGIKQLYPFYTGVCNHTSVHSLVGNQDELKAAQLVKNIIRKPEYLTNTSITPTPMTIVGNSSSINVSTTRSFMVNSIAQVMFHNPSCHVTPTPQKYPTVSGNRFKINLKIHFCSCQNSNPQARYKRRHSQCYCLRKSNITFWRMLGMGTP